MSTAYIPGPWQISRYSNGTHTAGVSNGVRGVATVFGLGREETDATARLIAAAPQMLVALRRIAEDYKSGGHAEEVGWNLTSAMEDVEVAIAKATGEAP